MHEFQTFAYLDVPKTGSTFISVMLRKFCSEDLVGRVKHGQVGDRYDPDKFYFISVRNPLEQYQSLYSYGCEGKGHVCHRLTRAGHGELYNSTLQGFRRWLKFVLDEDHVAYLDADFGEHEELARLIGLQTFRYLELALLDPIETLMRCKSRDDVRAAHQAKNIAQFIVRNENMSADLETLVTGRLRNSISDLDGALAYLAEGKRLNASKRIDGFEGRDALRAKQVGRLHEREWFLHELLGY